MNDKISKQKIYTDFSIHLDKLEYKLDKLLVLMESEKKEYKVVINNTIQDSEQFDTEYK